MALPNINYNNFQIIQSLGFNNDWNNIVPAQSQADYAANGLALAREDFEPVWNNVFSTLLNKIAKTVIQNSLMNNPLSGIRRGQFSMTGDTLEQIYVGLIKANTYDPDFEAGSPWRTSKADVESMFHRNPRRENFPITIYREDMGKAFRSENGLSNFINTVIGSMTQSNTAAEYIWSKQVFNTYVQPPAVGSNLPPLTPEQIRSVDFPIDKDTAEDFIIALKKGIRDLRFNSTRFNPKKKPTSTAPGNMALFVLADIMPTVEVKALAAAFNVGQLGVNVPIIELDDFGGANDIIAVLCDREFFMIADQMTRFESISNPEKLYTNFWFHVWQQYSVSYFHNCLIYKSNTPVPYAPNMP